LRILIDQTLDWQLHHDLTGHAVKSVSAIGWADLDSETLLAKAEKEFDVLITLDSNMLYHQHLSKYKIPIIALKSSSNLLADTQPLMPKVLDILPSIHTWKVMVVS